MQLQAPWRPPGGAQGACSSCAHEHLLPASNLQAGTVALPLFGGYCSAKFGLEALSDTLRYELHGQGIDVVCIKPGAVKTKIWGTGHAATSQLLDSLPPAAEARYGILMKKVKPAALAAMQPTLCSAGQPATHRALQIDKASKQAEAEGVSAGEVAELIAEALQADKPRAR